jgi:subtilisin family serine protease
MKSRYIVLRDLGPTRYNRAHEQLASASVDELQDIVRFRGSLSEPPIPSIDIVEAEPKHATELRRDERAVAIALEMPVLPVEEVQTDIEKNDEEHGPTWGITALGAHDCPFKGESAKVAVLDSGIRTDHAAFTASDLKINAEDFTGQHDITDQSGHGTHCAATILGREVRGHRIGVAPGVKELLVARIFAPGVATTTDMVSKAISWAAANGANVISMSLSFNFTGLAAELHKNGLPVEAATALALVEFQNNLRLFDGLTNLFRAQENFPNNHGVVIVGAAGNHSHRKSKSGEPIFTVPVAAPNNAVGVISVGALRRGESALDIAPFSNSGPTLAAPGFQVLSADIDPRNNDLLTLKNGTSMACPHVAGLAALWWDAVNLSGSPAKAQTVVVKLQAACRINPLDPGLNSDDRGLGIPVAPS